MIIKFLLKSLFLVINNINPFFTPLCFLFYKYLFMRINIPSPPNNNIITLLIKYGNKAYKILKQSDEPIKIRTYDMHLTYTDAINLINEEYVLITNDYFMNKYNQLIKITKLTEKELLIEIQNTKWNETYKLINEKVLIRKKTYKEIISKLFEYTIIDNNDVSIRDVKYFNKKVLRKIKSLSIECLNANNFHFVMSCKYDLQICNITPLSIRSYMLIFLIDIQMNESVGILDDVKGVLAFSVNERISNNNVIYFSKNSHSFIYNKNIYFNKRDSLLNYSFDLFIIASSYNKIQLIDSVNSAKFVIFISNLNELQEVSSFLFERTNKFTDISIKELLSREMEVKEYISVFIHPQIKGRLGNGWVISFITINI